MSKFSMNRRNAMKTIAIGSSALAFPGIVRSQELTIRAVSAWTQGTAFSKEFERFVDRVNETGKGIIQINYLGGGAKIMNVFDMGQAVKNGVFDILNTNSGYYSNLMPESASIKLQRVSFAQLKQNGGYDFLNEIMNKKMNSHWLGRGKGTIPFHIYFSKSVQNFDKPDLKGLRLRISPNYRAFFSALGATLVQTQGSEIYTAMERGVVDGFGWPIQGLDELGLFPVTATRVDPGFYTAPNEILINQNKWKSLSDEQRGVLQAASDWVETWLEDSERKTNEAAKEKQAANGIKAAQLNEADSKYFLDTAYDAGWAEIEKMAPQNAAKLRQLMS
ncbi:ABC transporter substrate-binding protein [Pusillimonas caeni]|uniref:TRAP transporter substrate-binding protein DctP n=1 Tax=Pusillimonas caeni TaxID=1348472 RepID=UPI000E5A0B46|nr:TRAP transporter substrate-binding protein DctP [Pusillimonas caeni]TFL14864.1 ABC transporter substrate-binding protein [Pusillimonas caeni]